MDKKWNKAKLVRNKKYREATLNSVTVFSSPFSQAEIEIERAFCILKSLPIKFIKKGFRLRYKSVIEDLQRFAMQLRLFHTIHRCNPKWTNYFSRKQMQAYKKYLSSKE